MIRQEARPLAHYLTQEGEPFHITEVHPGKMADARLRAAAAGIVCVLEHSWSKFVPDTLTGADYMQKMPTPNMQTVRIQQASPDVRYLVAVEGVEPLAEAEQVAAFARITQYRPRRPTLSNPLRRSYPNITDLEAWNGNIHTGDYATHAAALALHALENANGDHKAAAYTELPNLDGIAFFEEYGFVQTGNRPEENIGGSTMTYVHMEAERAAIPQRLLQEALRQRVIDI